MAAADVEQSFESLSCRCEINWTVISSLKGDQTTALKAFVDKTNVFAVIMTGIGITHFFDRVAGLSNFIHVLVSIQ